MRNYVNSAKITEHQDDGKKFSFYEVLHALKQKQKAR